MPSYKNRISFMEIMVYFSDESIQTPNRNNSVLSVARHVQLSGLSMEKPPE
jgi:hypothetical protein